MKIAEVSERYGLSSDTLRYYERIGLIAPVNRNGSGIRDYNDLDIRRVEFIKCMRSAGLPIEVLIDICGFGPAGRPDDRSPERNLERTTRPAGGADSGNAKNAGFVEPQDSGV